MPEDIEMGRRKEQDSASTSSIAEEEETEYQPINWKKIFLSPKYIPFHILAILVIIASVFITIRHDQVVATLRPFSEKVRDLPAGWLIPIAILFLISFPPLFGHEIIALLCGVVYGLWIGFAIVAAGTFLGEIGTWFAFKYLLRKKAAHLERTNINFAALVRLTHEGGFWIVLIIRLSAIPSHFSTAVFSTCNVNFWYFAISTFLTLPKQLFLVYLGVLLLQSQPDSAPKDVAFAIAGVVTFVMAGYIYWKMRGYKKVLLDEQARRKAERARRHDDHLRPMRLGTAASSKDDDGDGQRGGYQPFQDAGDGGSSSEENLPLQAEPYARGGAYDQSGYAQGSGNSDRGPYQHVDRYDQGSDHEQKHERSWQELQPQQRPEEGQWV